MLFIQQSSYHAPTPAQNRTQNEPVDVCPHCKTPPTPAQTSPVTYWCDTHGEIIPMKSAVVARKHRASIQAPQSPFMVAIFN